MSHPSDAPTECTATRTEGAITLSCSLVAGHDGEHQQLLIMRWTTSDA